MSLNLRCLNNKAMLTASPFVNMGCNNDLGLYIAAVKLEELEDLISYANYSLIKTTSDKVHAAERDIETKTARKALRFYFLRSAILSYHACFDYIIQIAYFGFGFHRTIKTNANYLSELRVCSFGTGKKSFRSAFNHLLERIDFTKGVPIQVSSAREFYKRLVEFYDEDRKSINSLANQLKHQGSLNIAELAPQRQELASVHCAFEYDDDGRFSGFGEIEDYIPFSDIVKPKLVDINEIVRMLIGYNKLICTFVDYLQEQLGLKDLPAKCKEKDISVQRQSFTKQNIEQWLKTKN